MEAYQAFSNSMLSIKQSQRQQLQGIEYCLMQLLQGMQPDCYLTLRQNLPLPFQKKTLYIKIQYYE